MAKKTKKELPQFITTSRVKEFNKSADFNTSSDFVDALNASVAVLIEDAQRRAGSNNRKTLRADDL